MRRAISRLPNFIFVSEVLPIGNSHAETRFLPALLAVSNRKILIFHSLQKQSTICYCCFLFLRLSLLKLTVRSSLRAPPTDSVTYTRVHTRAATLELCAKMGRI